MTYTLGEIAEILDAQLQGKDDQQIDFLLYDSRGIVPSSNSIFFALQGKRDGHKFLGEMADKGVRNFVVTRMEQSFPTGNYIIVRNSLEALQTLAAYHRSRFNIPVFAITGSNGKTIVKDWLAYFLQEFANVVRSPKSFNSQIGVPLSVWEMSAEHDIAIFEAGISRPGEMKNLEKIIRPNLGIFTVLGDAHQENFLSLEQKLDEKLELFVGVDKIYYSKDQSLVHERISQRFSDKKLITWSYNTEADLQIAQVQSGSRGTQISALFRGKEVRIHLGYTDKASLFNAITVWLVLLDMYGSSMVSRLDFSRLPQIEMRLQQIRGIRETTIINDSYNCDLTSLRIALDYLEQQSARKRKTVILSDLEQIAAKDRENSMDRVYSNVADLIQAANIDRFIGVGLHIGKYSYLFSNAEFFDTTDDLLRHLQTLNFHDEIILLKGARRFRFERISRALQQKSHRTVFEINLNALRHNLNYFRAKLSARTKLMVMVKAFSYGSGSYEIANLLQNEKVDYLGVAIADEGVELREAGIKLPIIVMNPDSDNFDLFPEYGLEPEIYSFGMLEKFYKAVRHKVHYPLPVHIKFNTGMNRLGFDVWQAEQVIERLRQMSDVLMPRSVFSHLAGSPEEQFDEFTIEQIRQFEQVAMKFKQQFGPQVIAHILNSAGIERFTWAQMDMVRLGIGLYGISAVDDGKLQHIGTLKTRISQLRKVKAGQSIGYSRGQFVDRDSLIAIIPIGYADGLNRRLSKGRGKVCIRGKLAPIIGNVNMDMTMVDVTDIEGVQEGDEVIIFGKCPSIKQVAQWLDTIPYEVLTSVSHRVKRVYVYE